MTARLKLKQLKDELERLGLVRSRGVRVASKHVVKSVGDERYWAWVAVDIHRFKKGYRIVFYAECEGEDLVLKVARRLAEALKELEGEGYA
jgi:hypothetical protein